MFLFRPFRPQPPLAADDTGYGDENHDGHLQQEFQLKPSPDGGPFLSRRNFSGPLDLHLPHYGLCIEIDGRIGRYAWTLHLETGTFLFRRFLAAV